jgi:hypothetical protein
MLLGERGRRWNVRSLNNWKKTVKYDPSHGILRPISLAWFLPLVVIVLILHEVKLHNVD